MRQILKTNAIHWQCTEQHFRRYAMRALPVSWTQHLVEGTFGVLQHSGESRFRLQIWNQKFLRTCIRADKHLRTQNHGHLYELS